MSKPTVLLVILLIVIGVPIAVVTGVTHGAGGLLVGVPVLAAFLLVAWRNWGREGAWWLPLAFIVILPAVTVPAQSYLLERITSGFAYNASAYHQFGTVADAGQCAPVYDGGFDMEWSCPRIPATLTLAPGLLIFATFAWMAAGDSGTRGAAVIAGVLGVLRFGVPLAIYMSRSDVQIIGSYQFFEQGYVNNGASVLSLMLWALTLFALLAMVGAHRLSPGEDAGSSAAAASG